jgi:hypothetical protein
VTVADWLSHRAPAPPRVLQERVADLVRAVPEPQGTPGQALLAAAEMALARLVRTVPADRASALDLLAIDALVTYALEYAAETPESLPAVSAEAMSRLSRVAAR